MPVLVHIEEDSKGIVVVAVVVAAAFAVHF